MTEMAPQAAPYVSGGPAPKPGTLNELFFAAIEKFDKPDAMMVKRGGKYEPIGHRDGCHREPLDLLLERVDRSVQISHVVRDAVNGAQCLRRLPPSIVNPPHLIQFPEHGCPPMN